MGKFLLRHLPLVIMLIGILALLFVRFCFDENMNFTLFK